MHPLGTGSGVVVDPGAFYGPGLYRCWCGHSTTWIGSWAAPPSCFACPRCDSNLARSPAEHRIPDEHRFLKTISQPGVFSNLQTNVCARCGQMRPARYHDA